MKYYRGWINRTQTRLDDVAPGKMEWESLPGSDLSHVYSYTEFLDKLLI